MDQPAIVTTNPRMVGQTTGNSAGATRNETAYDDFLPACLFTLSRDGEASSAMEGWHVMLLAKYGSPSSMLQGFIRSAYSHQDGSVIGLHWYIGDLCSGLVVGSAS